MRKVSLLGKEPKEYQFLFIQICHSTRSVATRRNLLFADSFCGPVRELADSSQKLRFGMTKVGNIRSNYINQL